MEGSMRLVSLVIAAAIGCGAAFAQPAPRVTIEDDVAPATALSCAALRMAQVESVKRSGGTPDALVAASLAAWLKAGVDAAGAKAEAAKVTLATTASLADTCSTFEIRSAPPAGG
jgi:hypothetical protein